MLFLFGPDADTHNIFGGHRTIEGGADVDTVYTVAWLNAVVGGIGVRF